MGVTRVHLVLPLSSGGAWWLPRVGQRLTHGAQEGGAILDGDPTFLDEAQVVGALRRLVTARPDQVRVSDEGGGRLAAAFWAELTYPATAPSRLLSGLAARRLDACDVGGEEVNSVAVEVPSGAVVVLGGSGVGVPREDLGVA